MISCDKYLKFEYVTHLKYTLLNYSPTFTYIWIYPMSKGLKSIFILNALPSYEHTEEHGKILEFKLSHLFGKEEKPIK